MEAPALGGGFGDAAREAAGVFRVALDCMARPGQVATLACARPPAPVGPAAGTLLLALADADTPVWMPDRLAPGLADWLAFHTGARRAEDPGQAVFAIGTWEELQPLPRWPAGDPAYPDRGATLVVEVPALEGGPALALTGPGIEGARSFAPAVPEGAAAALRANGARFPLGLDFFLAAGDRVAALPRSTRIGG